MNGTLKTYGPFRYKDIAVLAEFPTPNERLKYDFHLFFVNHSQRANILGAKSLRASIMFAKICLAVILARANVRKAEPSFKSATHQKNNWFFFTMLPI